MLDLHKPIAVLFGRINKSLFLPFGITLFFLSPLLGMEYQDGFDSQPRQCEHEWVLRYFNSLDDESFNIEESVDFLVSLKASLEAKGYDVPSLAELCLQTREYIVSKGIEVEEEEFSCIYNEIIKREGALVTHSSFSHAPLTPNLKQEITLTKKNKKKAGMSDGFAKGFIKALGGALLCVIPHPITWAVGGGLVVSGVNDMVNHANDENSNISSAEDKMDQLSPPADHVSP